MEETIAILRERGPDGLQLALEAHDRLQADVQKQQAELDKLVATDFNGKKEPIAKLEASIAETNRQLERTAAAVDQIGGQRSCSISRLYWYTDLEQAKAEAARTGRPILSLRMLGKLTDEYSCANSRFFRTALYSNKKISDFLRTNFVLHWQSVRPVPRITIDFGDGRKLKRTITGNSAHFVLTSDGTPLDVLPGLYSPLAFTQWLWDAHHFHSEYVKTAVGERSEVLQAYHANKRDGVLRRWDLDIQRLGAERSELVTVRMTNAINSARIAGVDVPAEGPAPKAARAAKLAVGKTAAEAPVLRFAKLGGTWMERGMDDELWQAIADLHREDVALDEPSIKLIRHEFPRAVDAARISVSKSWQEDPVLRMVRTFEDSMTLDMVRNEYLLHRRIHEAFAEADAVTAAADRLNEWVYAELFLTPSSDPWLGLAPRDVYTALDGDGRTEPTTEVAGSAGGE
jgi:hypothetical protein